LPRCIKMKRVGGLAGSAANGEPFANAKALAPRRDCLRKSLRVFIVNAQLFTVPEGVGG
jgi:hypothetical protein